ncbi:MAG: iron-sulfur cluster assembly scaffold protein [Patescibacteria group bacterium]
MFHDKNMEEIIYKEMILDLYRHPLNKGILSSYDATAHDFSTSCGDDITIYLKFDDMGRIAEIMHDGQGGAISQAAVSLLTEEIKGKQKEMIPKITEEKMIGMLGIPVSYTRKSCALLGLKTLQKTFTNIEHRSP